MKRHTHATWLSSLLLCTLLAACASSLPLHPAEEPSEEAFSSFEEGCADASTVVLLCEGLECGFFRCRDLALEPSGIQLTRGSGGFIASPAAPGGRPRRWRGGSWLRRNSSPVLTFRLYASLDPKPLPSSQPLRLQPGRYIRHHLFSQASDLAAWFKKQGVKIHRFTMVIEETVHRRIHSGGPRGGLWNEAWRQFMSANPNATPEEIYRHAGELIYRFELVGPIVPYSSPRR